MVTDILNKMAEIVANNMIAFQSDFEKYDKEYIIKKGVKAFPFLWMVHRSHTYLIRLSEIRKDYFENEAFRYDIAQQIAGFTLICGPDAVRLLKIFIS